MANLKDIRTRINSVKTTRQVTNAMKMVSAAKLKKAQDDTLHIRAYTSRLLGICQDLILSFDKRPSCVYTEQGKEGKTVIIAIASNRGLCGVFNTNIAKEVQSLILNDYQEEYKAGNVVVGVLGKQVGKMLKTRKIKADFDFNDLIQAPSFAGTKKLAKKLMDGFAGGEYKNVILVYNEFVNAAIQRVCPYQYLPFIIPETDESSRLSSEYIFEPDVNSIINSLVPELLESTLFQVLLESLASEHGARMTSMHKATDNASELINDLQLSYNKARQSAITNEIIEVTSGANALGG